MGWHPVNQRVHRVHTNGPVDLQSGGLAVSEALPHMAAPTLTGLVQIYLGH